MAALRHRFRMRSFTAALVALPLLALAACELPATNPLDPDAPDGVRADAVLDGVALFADGRPPDGIVVTALDKVGVEVATATTTADTGGAFSLSVPSKALTILAAAPGFAADAVEVAPLPGEQRTLAPIVLQALPPTSVVRGAVAVPAPRSPAGARVSLVELTPEDDCRVPAASVSVDAAGTFTFPAVRAGRYRLFVAAAGTRTALSLPFDVADNAVVDAAAITLVDGADAVVLEAGGAVVTATADDAVDVVVAAQEGLDTLQIGLDPGFDPAQGATDLLPFAERTAFALPDVDGAVTVFVQLSGPCGVSPVSSEPLVVDRTPPLLLSLTINGVAVGADTTAQVVLRDAAASVRVSLAGLDESGLDALIVEGDVSTTRPLDVDGVQVVADVDVAIPAAEGSYAIALRARDRAGNLDPRSRARRAVVVRDLSAPRTPLVTTARLETFDARALLWLDEQAGCPVGAEPFACETVPPNGPLFQVRGGALLDFTPVVGPPFVVDVPDDATTRFEIRAVDAAGNASAGVGVVEVVRVSTRSRFSVPLDREVGVPVIGRFPEFAVRASLDEPAVPPLVASGGTAFFAVRPTVGDVHETAYTVLVAQPADVGDVGVRYSTSPLPSALRRLGYDSDPGQGVSTYGRLAGGLGAGAGRLGWLEITDDDDDGLPHQLVLGLDGDGRFDLRGADVLTLGAPVDLDNERTVNRAPGEVDSVTRNAACTVIGPARCAPDVIAWNGFGQQTPSTTAMDGRHLVVPGLQGAPDAIAGVAATALSLPAGDVRLVGQVFTVLDRDARFAGTVTLPLEVPAGTPLQVGLYTEGFSADLDLADFSSFSSGDDNVLAIVAVGGGVETLPLPQRPLSFLSPGDTVLFGVLIPADVDATLSLVESAGLTASPADVGLEPAGVLIETGSDTAALAELTLDVDLADRAIPLTVTMRDVGLGGAPPRAGLAVVDVGSDGVPDGAAIRTADLAARQGAVADERRLVLLEDAPSVVGVVSAAPDLPLVPGAGEGCLVVVEVTEDTPVERFTLEGQGLLDELEVAVFASVDGRSSGLFERELTDFPRRVPFVGDEGDCADITATSRLDVTTSHDVAAVETLADDRVIGTAPTATSQSYDIAADATVDVSIVTVTGGDLVRLITRTTAAVTPLADPDLFIRFDTGDTDACAFESGDEDCEIGVPEGATSMTVAVLAFDGDAVGVLDVTVLPVLFPLGDFAVAATAEELSLSLAAVDLAEVAMVARFDAEPTPDLFDCLDDRFFPFCLLTPPSGAARLFVAASPFADVDPGEAFEVRLVQRRGVAPVELTRRAVFPGETVRATFDNNASDGPTLELFFEDAAGAALATNRCSASTFASPQQCQETVPAGAATVVVRALPDVDGAAALSLRLEAFASGCASVVASARFGPQVLRAGRTYALAVTSGDFGARTIDWPDSAPAIFTGEPLPSPVGGLRVLGTTTTPRALQTGQLLVPPVDVGQACRLGIDVQQRTRVELPSVQGQLVAALLIADGSARVAAARLDDDAPALTAIHTPAAGSRVVALAADDDALQIRLVEADDAVVRLGAATVGDTPTSCVAFEEPFAVQGAAFVDTGDAVVVFGEGLTGPEALVLDLDVDPCAPPTVRARRLLQGVPRAAALDGDDLFVLIDAEGTHGRLVHIDLRPVRALIPAGRREVVGASPLADGRVVAGLAPRVAGSGALVVVDPRTGVTATLSSGPIPFQPVVVGEGDDAVIVSVDVAAVAGGRPAALARPVAGGPAVDLAVDLADAPGFNVLDTRAFARDPILAADGTRLAVLGHVPAGRSLSVLTLAGVVVESRVTFNGTLSDGPLSLTLSGDVVVVGAADGARAFVVDTDALVELDIADDERLVGASGGSLLVARDPGDLFGAPPAVSLGIVRRDPQGIVDDVDLGETLPAATFGRPFLACLDDGGDVVLLDDVADPPLLWGLRPGAATPLDGALRPLASATATLGRSAAAPGLVVRAGPAGASLYQR